jgi:hypothetical protein
MDEQSSERVFRWTVVVEYRPKLTRPDQVSWEVYREDGEYKLIEAGRGTDVFDEMADVAGFLYDDAEGR